jgi:hypothetical protein
VPNASSPTSARCRARGTLSSNQRNFRALK